MGSYKKKLFIVLLLFSLISCFACSSVNAGMSDVTYTVDTPTLLKEQQEFLANAFIRKSLIISDVEFNNTFKSYLGNNFYFPLFKYQVFNNVGYLTCYFIPVSIRYETLDNYNTDIEDAYFEDNSFIYPVSGFSIAPSNVNVSSFKRFTILVSGSTHASTDITSTIFIPSVLIYYDNQTCNNYINGINPTTSPWAMLFSAINENTEATEDTTQAVNNLRNDFNAEESDDDYDFPTDNPTTDPTSSGIDNIFNMFYMRINSWNALGINVPIPFTGKSFSISPDITENIINGWTPTTQIATVFKSLLSGVWYYLLGRYIVKDVQHYVDGLQTGDILTKSDTNIKTEML